MVALGEWQLFIRRYPYNGAMWGEQKGFEKAAAKRTKRLKQTHERVLKEQAALEKIVGQVYSQRN